MVTMPATDPYRAAALADLTRAFVSTFGEAMPVEHFAAPRPDGQPWETNGRWYVREGGKTKRIKNPKAGAAREAASGAGRADPNFPDGLPDLADVPTSGRGKSRAAGAAGAGNLGSPDWRKKFRADNLETAKADLDKAKRVLAGVDPPPPGTTGADARTAVRKAQYRVTKLEARNIPAAALPAMRTGQRADTPGGEIGPRREPTPLGNPAQARPTAPRRPKVKTFLPPATPPTPPAPPPPTPAETAKLDGYEREDSARYGSRASRVIRRVTEALRGLGTLGGLVSGAGLGAKIGGAVAGPLGLALGTAVGGGLGGLAGMWAGNRAAVNAGGAPGPVPSLRSFAPPRGLTQRGRARAEIRKAARTVAPAAAAGLAGGATVGAGVGTQVAGLASGDPAKAVLGVLLGGGAASQAGDVADLMGKATRGAMATSAVSRRRADRRDRRPFAEAFAEPLPPDVLQVVKARLAEMAVAAGYQLPPIPDEVVLKAIEMAQQDDAAGAVSEFQCAAKTAVRKFSRLARC